MTQQQQIVATGTGCSVVVFAVRPQRLPISTIPVIGASSHNKLGSVYWGKWPLAILVLFGVVLVPVDAVQVRKREGSLSVCECERERARERERDTDRDRRLCSCTQCCGCR